MLTVHVKIMQYIISPCRTSVDTVEFRESNHNTIIHLILIMFDTNLTYYQHHVHMTLLTGQQGQTKKQLSM